MVIEKSGWNTVSPIELARRADARATAWINFGTRVRRNPRHLVSNKVCCGETCAHLLKSGQLDELYFSWPSGVWTLEGVVVTLSGYTNPTRAELRDVRRGADTE